MTSFNYCPHCGRKIEDKSHKFCSDCGGNLQAVGYVYERPYRYLYPYPLPEYIKYPIVTWGGNTANINSGKMIV